jgi:hypothetical protein
MPVRHGDGELASGVSGLEVAHGVGRPLQRIGVLDGARQLVGFDEPSETFEIGVVLLRGLDDEPSLR